MNTQDKYIVYKRKSSDNEDKQIASLPSQDRTIKESIPDFALLNIIADYEEAKSAKAPGRQKFNQMCEKLERGEAKYIITWALNRLARNPVDGGRILWLVQDKGIKIITPSKTYGEDDILLMYVEFAMSNQFITDLRKSTLRGIQDKLRAGLAPQLAPNGYYNDTTKKQGLKDILVDELRFPLVRKMWDLLLTGNYSPVRILEIANKEWGYRQRNGKPLSRSRIYEMFTDVFYIGKFIYRGELYQGTHTPMISEEEFEKVQKILGIRGKPMTKGKQFAYSGLIRCNCGSGITAHERYRKICSTCHLKFNAERNDKCPKCGTEAPEKTTYYCYYHCNRKANEQCKQPHISLVELEKQIDATLATIEIPQDFINWTLEMIRKANAEDIKHRELIDANLYTTLSSLKKKLDNLTTKYLSDANANGEILNDEEFKEQKQKLIITKLELETKIKETSTDQNSWINTAEKAFNFARNARHWFAHGTKEDKRTILQALGLNLILEDRKLHINLQKPFKAIQQVAEVINRTNEKFEPIENVDLMGKMAEFELENPIWGQWLDAVRTSIKETKLLYPIPDYSQKYIFQSYLSN